MAWDDNSFTTLSSGATHYRDWRASTDDGYDYVVVGSGTPATDDAAITTAVTALNSAGRGTLWIDGDVYVTSSHTFTAPIRLRGRGSYARIRYSTDGTANVFIWDGGGLPSGPDAGHYTISATKGDEYFTTTAFTPARGDYVVLYSSNAITSVYPASTNQYPSEIHRVEGWDSSNNRAYLDSPIIDTLSTGAKAVVLTDILDDVVIENIAFDFSGTTQPDLATALYLRGVNGAKLENVHFEKDGPGCIWLTYAMNSRLAGITIEGTDKTDGVYGVVAGLVNGFVMSDFHITGTRHAFTTTSHWSPSTDRYGTPARIRLSNGVVSVPTKKDFTSARSGIDTHAEGYGITIDGVSFAIGDGASGINHGVSVRSRNVTIKNCKFEGQEDGTNYGGYGIMVSGPNCVIDSCQFDRLTWGVNTSYQGGSEDELAAGCVVSNCLFRNHAGPGVRSTNSSNHVVSNCNFFSVGRRTGGTPAYAAAAVDFRYGSGHKVVNNYMPKASNTYSVAFSGSLDKDDIDVYGNVFTGYSGPVCGFGGTDAANAETKYQSYNFYA